MQSRFDLSSERRERRWPRRLLLLALLLTLIWAGLGAFRVGPAPRIGLETGLPGIGKRTPVRATFEEPKRGLTRIRLELVQGELAVILAEASYRPRPPWAFWGERTPRAVLEAEAGSESVEGLRSGEAVLRATAEPAGAWLRRPEPVVLERTLPVRLTPPALQVLSSRHYPAQGGCEAVVYRVGETSVRDGVASGERFFPGSPLPGGSPDQRFTLFAVPYDLDDPSRVRLVAEDDVGNRATAAFIDRFFPKAFSTDDIQVGDEFMAKVVPQILANTPGAAEGGSLLESYLWVNRDLRRENAATLEELAAGSRPEFLWKRPFQPMPNAQVMSAFADRRTYFHQGQEVDREDHLGFDLASVRKAPVPAANSGVVALARYFGIYGNAVVIDHGLGLMSLYGHLSSIAVTEGERVERGQLLGRTGETGLAGGDHLHFTMLLGGLPVDPKEWWDRHWVETRIAGRLGAGRP